MNLIASHRGRPSDDPIFSLHQEANRRRELGEAVVDATIGVLLDDAGRLAVLPSAARAVRDVDANEWAAYAPIAGTPQFRRAVIDDLLAQAPELRRCAVAVATPGGSGAIRHAIANYLEPGQAALTSHWFWSPYQTLCDECDRRLDTYEMFAPGGGLNLSALDAALGRHVAEQGRALLIVNDPAHNPTGYTMTEGEWSSVAEMAASHAKSGPVTVLVDCAYLHYGPGDPRALPPRLEGRVGKATVLFAWSASKSFTHYGLRVGALVACVSDATERAMVESALSYSCRGTWSNCNRGGLAAITRLLVDPELARASTAERAELKTQLLLRVEAFNRLAPPRGLRYPRYDGGFFVTVFSDSPREKAASMRERGLFVVPQVAPTRGGQPGRTDPGGEANRGGVLRLALCAVAARDVGSLVDALGA